MRLAEACKPGRVAVAFEECRWGWRLTKDVRAMRRTDGHDKTGWGPTGRRFLYCTAAFCFGAVDQYLGASWVSTHVGFWTIAVSGLSAPWLLLAFGAGWFEADRRAALAM